MWPQSHWNIRLVFLSQYKNFYEPRLGVAVACAIKAALERHNLSGKIVLLGTPGNALVFFKSSMEPSQPIF